MVVASPFVQGRWSLKKFNATVLNDIWPETLFFTLIATMVASVTQLTRHKLGISNSLITVLGTVLGLVISFRTSSAYERYQDGRKLWTNIAIASRNLAQLIWIHVPIERIKTTNDTDPDHVTRDRLKAVIEKRSMINLIQAFAVAVKHDLRGEAGIYYQDLYPLIAFLPRHHSISESSGSSDLSQSLTDHDILPMWTDHEKLADSARSTPTSTLTLNHAHQKRHSHQKHHNHHNHHQQYEPEKALPRVVCEVPLKPARNPPRPTIYDHLPILLIFKPFILLPKWFYKRYLSPNHATNATADAEIDAELGARTLSGHKKTPPPISSNIPLQITLYLHSYVQFLLAKPGAVQPAIATGFINNLGTLQDTVNNLERVQNTPIPFAYQAHLRMSLWLYLAFLPFQVVSTLEWWTIPGTCFTSFLLLGFLEIGQEIENPFNYDENDLDLDKFCIAIQRELHEVTAHPTPGSHSYIFTDFNKPFAPSDERTAREIIDDVTHEYHTWNSSGSGDSIGGSGVDPIRRTLVKNWRVVHEVTTKRHHHHRQS